MEGIVRRRRNQFREDLATGTYDLVALDVLRDGPAYVYALIRRIAKQSRGAFLWREGTAYRVWHHLEEQGLATGDWCGPKSGCRRRYYRLTDRGRHAWAERHAEWTTFRKALDLSLRQ
jgi:PadR family transcriptional regulator, regulatory protein PadR